VRLATRPRAGARAREQLSVASRLPEQQQRATAPDDDVFLWARHIPFAGEAETDAKDAALELALIDASASGAVLVKSTQTSWLPRDRSGESEVR
jgi:hypothetical protein